MDRVVEGPTAELRLLSTVGAEKELKNVGRIEAKLFGTVIRTEK